MYDEKYVPTEEDMKMYEALKHAGKRFSEYTDDEADLIIKVSDYLSFKSRLSDEEMDCMLDEGGFFLNAPSVNGMSPMEVFREITGYNKRHVSRF